MNVFQKTFSLRFVSCVRYSENIVLPLGYRILFFFLFYFSFGSSSVVPPHQKYSYFCNNFCFVMKLMKLTSNFSTQEPYRKWQTLWFHSFGGRYTSITGSRSHKIQNVLSLFIRELFASVVLQFGSTPQHRVFFLRYFYSKLKDLGVKWI